MLVWQDPEPHHNEETARHIQALDIRKVLGGEVRRLQALDIRKVLVGEVLGCV